MSKFKTINIHGKQYVEVHEKIKYFRENFKGWAMTSEFVELTEKRCTIKTSIANQDGYVIATGIAYETEGSTFINKTSFMENCETSANGRALSNFGIGIETGIASADEVKTAIDKQKPSLKEKVAKICEPAKLTETKFKAMLKALEQGKVKEVKDRLPSYELSKSQQSIINQIIKTK